LRDRIGGHQKFTDNVLMNNPDPSGSHFMPNEDRFNKDFASYDKQVRDQERLRKQ